MALPVVKRIVHKHMSLGINPEHYPIVGTRQHETDLVAKNKNTK